MTQQELEEIAVKAEPVFERLRPMLEAQYDRKFIAIHADTGEYEVARTSGDAMRAIHKRYPEGPLYIRKIGNEPEWGLIQRLFPPDLTAVKEKS